MWYLNTRKNTIFLLVKISILSLTSGLSLKLSLNSLVYHRNIFGSSSKVLGNLRKFSEILGKCSGTFVWSSGQFEKSSEGGRKSSENHQKRRHQYVYIINRIIHGRLEIWNLSSRVHIRYLTRSRRSLVRYRCEHSKIIATMYYSLYIHPYTRYKHPYRPYINPYLYTIYTLCTFISIIYLPYIHRHPPYMHPQRPYIDPYPPYIL